MYEFVYICVCVHVNVYVCGYVSMCKCVCMCMCVYVCESMCGTYVDICVYTSVCVVCVYVYLSV
jgi:hypothetical protein